MTVTDMFMVVSILPSCRPVWQSQSAVLVGGIKDTDGDDRFADVYT